MGILMQGSLWGRGVAPQNLASFELLLIETAHGPPQKKKKNTMESMSADVAP